VGLVSGAGLGEGRRKRRKAPSARGLASPAIARGEERLGWVVVCDSRERARRVRASVRRKA
jgi:hypothetical protein